MKVQAFVEAFVPFCLFGNYVYMGLYNIVFTVFCIILILLTFLGLSKNILTSYGVGLIIGIFVFGIISYDVWVNFQIREILQQVQTADSDSEKQMLLQKLMRNFGFYP